MNWLPIIALAALAFLAAVFVLRIGKGGWTILGATLLFGLTGYALQGSPGQPAAPGKSAKDEVVDGELLVEARREFFDTSQFPSRWIVRRILRKSNCRAGESADSGSSKK